MDMQKRLELTMAALLGEAAGDAFGVPVEFAPRWMVKKVNLRDMVGSDTNPDGIVCTGDLVPAGSWSDDTSMTLASMASFVRNGGAIDYEDQMAQFIRWWDGGEYCCLSYPFGLGGNVGAAMDRYKRGTPALECGGKAFMENGNGALMRILPFSLYCIFHGLDTEETVSVTGKGSAITHGHEISRMCCFIWTEFLRALAEGKNLDSAIDVIEGLPYGNWFSEETLRELNAVTEGKIRRLSEEDIGETGYVKDTLYAALYSLRYAGDFETSIRNAVNLGYDTDTNGAVTGMAAGILYGLSGIPERWLTVLGGFDTLADTARDFAACVGQDGDPE